MKGAIRVASVEHARDLVDVGRRIVGGGALPAARDGEDEGGRERDGEGRGRCKRDGDWTLAA